MAIAARSSFSDVVPEQAVSPEAIDVFRATRFPRTGPFPWLDRPDALEAIEAKLAAGEVTPAQADVARTWVRDGVVVLSGFYRHTAALDKVWAAYEAALAAGTLVPDAQPTEADPLFGRTLNPHFAVPQVDKLLRDPAVVRLVSMLLGVAAEPFQTILGHKGSEQLEHSDAIHMTTYPLGYLAGTWIAFEDITPESGPLVYYPGSHRLPYVFSDDVGISIESYRENGIAEYHSRYEPRIQELIREYGLEPRRLLAKKGDLLIWHANLIHGGSPRDAMVSRKALVCHYFAKGCITYHDIAGHPSHLIDRAR